MFDQETRCGSRCSFCGTTGGPFLQVQGLFPLLMCAACQAARAHSNRGPEQPAELLAHYDRGQPWYQWGCPLPGCGQWVILPWALEAHATVDHPCWVARYELVRPLPDQYERVVFRRVDQPPQPPAS
jgi:hypothetical protein